MITSKQTWIKGYSKLTFALTTFSLVAVSASCGIKAPHVNERPSGEVVLPNFPSQSTNTDAAMTDSDFGLTDHQAGTLVYEGRLIFWSPKATPAQMSDVNQTVILGRKNKQAALVYAQDEALPVRKDLATHLAAIDGAKTRYLEAGAKGLRSPEVLAAARPAIESWFAEITKRLAETEPHLAERLPVVHARWAAYCDGKLWELATSTLILESFTSRPTPHALCEPYYASQQYFAHAERCGAKLEGESYLDCLWLDGVLKTPQWQSIASEPATAKCSSASTSTTKQAALEKWLAHDLAAPNASAIARILAQPTDQAKFATAVMNGSPFRRAEFSSAAMDDLGQCPTAMQRKTGHTTDNLTQANPRRLLEIVEISFKLGYDSGSLPLIPVRMTVPPDDGLKAKDQALYQQITSVAGSLGIRFATASGLRVSVSDILFNHPIGKTLPTQSVNNETEESLESLWNRLLPTDEQKVEPAFKPLIERKNAYAAPFAAEVAAAEQSYQDFKAKFEARERHLNNLLSLEQGSTAAGILAVNSPDATVFFSTFSLKLTPQGNDTLLVDWLIDESASACVALRAGAKCDSEQAAPWAEKNSPLKAEFDPATNKLTLSITLDQPDRFGFKEIIRTADQIAKAADLPLQRFNDTPTAVWQGKVAKLELYGQRLNGHLDIFAGNAYLMDGESKVLQGSISGDRFDQTLRNIKSSIAK